MLTGPRYAVNLNAVTVSTAVTVMEITAHASRVCVIIEAWLTQETSETSQQEVIQFVRKSGAGTGTSFTPLAIDTVGTAGFTARASSFSAEGTVTDQIGPRQGFNALSGWFYAPLPESRIIVPPSGILGLRFPTAPASATWSGGMIVMEIPG
jgi:hypothetical protein